MPYTPDLSTLPPLVREFAAYKLTIQGCSEKTVNEYALDLRTFFRWLKLKRAGQALSPEALANTDVSEITLSDVSSVTTEEIYEFLMYADSAMKNHQAAKARKLSAIKAFYKYLTVKRHLCENNPAITIEAPKQKKQLPKFLSLEESERLLSAVVNDTESKTRNRDYAIITLFLNCGMRLSELCGISLGDVDRELRSLRVFGKGAKERVVYLNDACRAALLDYLKIRASATDPAGRAKHKTDALFLSSRGQRISAKTVQWMVYKYLDAAGLDARGLSVHKLRHTAATLMYQTGEVDIRVLKDILGHEQLTTTQIYTHVSDAGMEAAISRNPLNFVKKSQRTSEENNDE